MRTLSRMRCRLETYVRKKLMPWKVKVTFDTKENIESATLASNAQFMSANDWFFEAKNGHFFSVPKEMAARSYVEMEEV